MLIKLTGIYTLFIPLSLLLTYFSLPGNNGFTWFVWFCITPIFLAIDLQEFYIQSHSKKRRLNLFLLGGWGLFWWCFAIWWLIPASTAFIGVEKPLAISVYFILCIFLALPYFLSGLLWQLTGHRTVTVDLLIKASLLTALIGLFDLAIPANIAHSLFEQTLSIQIVSITGVSGLVFCVLLVNIGLAKAIFSLIKADQSRAIPAFTISLICFSLLHLYGAAQLYLTKKQSNSAFTIAYIQPNLVRDDTVKPLIAQTEAFIKSHPNVDLIVWPELPIIFSWQERRSQQRMINRMLSKLNKPLMLNSGYVYPQTPQYLESGKQYYSTVQLVSARGELVGNYSKQMLVPFFEYLPFEQSWPKIRQYFPNALRYIPGEDQTILTYTLEKSGKTQQVYIAPSICYEMIFSQYPRELKKQEASIFINPSNDTWFSGTGGSVRHFALALFRSVENRTPWIRVNNSGISGATNAYGEIIEGSLTSINTKENKIVTVQLNQDGTFYSRFGDVFLYLISIFSFVFLLRQWRARNDMQ